MKKSWTGIAVVLMASTMGCGSEAIGTDHELSSEGDIASAEQAVWEDGWRNGGDGWNNGGDGWNNGGDGWNNGGDGWNNGRQGWLVGDNAYSQVATDGVTTGYANAWSNAYGTIWTNGWNYSGMASFAWADQQSCAHPVSQTGSALANGCNPMVTRVCNTRASCCSTEWDSDCVRAATTLAGLKGTEVGCFAGNATTEVPTYIGTGMTIEQCAYQAQMNGFVYAHVENGGQCFGQNTVGSTPASASSCNTPCSADSTETCGGLGGFYNVWQVPSAHPVTETGASLASTDNECAAAVIAADAHCGSTAWDTACVKKAAQICAERYVTRARFEDGRNMVDVCAEPKMQGYPACPFAGSGPTGKECCRRALVLNGVYRRIDSTTKGVTAEWRATRTATLLGSSQTVKATIVPDPCVIDFNGNVVCQNEPHFWQASGPNGTVYPDCSGAGGPRPCNGSSSDQMTQTIVTGTGWSNAPYRGILVAVMSALVTTNGHYTIDIRSQESIAPLPFHPDPGVFEAEWKWDVTNAAITGKAVCKNPDGYYRAPLLTGVPDCYTMEFDPPANYIQSTWNPSAD